MRRGDVRSALLVALLDGPGHGYELIRLLEERTEGRWRPSPGSVYPTLEMLADEGLVSSTEADGRRTFALTDTGRTEAEERVATKGLPWDQVEGDEHSGLRAGVRDLHLAVKQVALSGSPQAVRQATEIVTKARKDLYRILAED